VRLPWYLGNGSVRSAPHVLGGRPSDGNPFRCWIAGASGISADRVTARRWDMWKKTIRLESRPLREDAARDRHRPRPRARGDVEARASEKVHGAGMTKSQWNDEVSRAVERAGLPWTVFAAWTEQSSPMCCASLSDMRSGQERRISLARDRFPTEVARRAEIVRQLQGPAPRRFGS
jgi:hypothetical protein